MRKLSIGVIETREILSGERHYIYRQTNKGLEFGEQFTSFESCPAVFQHLGTSAVHFIDVPEHDKQLMRGLYSEGEKSHLMDGDTVFKICFNMIGFADEQGNLIEYSTEVEHERVIVEDRRKGERQEQG